MHGNAEEPEVGQLDGAPGYLPGVRGQGEGEGAMIGLFDVPSAWGESDGEALRERLRAIREAKKRAYEALCECVSRASPVHIDVDDRRKTEMLTNHIDAIERCEAYYEQELSRRLFWTAPVKVTDEID